MTAQHATDLLIIGAGQAAVDVINGLKKSHYEGRITLLGNEKRLPYERPPLSKAVIAEQISLERLTLRGEKYYEGIDLKLGDPAVSMDPVAHTVETASGLSISYQQCVLTMGARAVPSPWSGSVYLMRNFEDALGLRDRISAGAKKFLVIGGGFLGLESASALCDLGGEVSLVEARPQLLPEKSSQFLSNWLYDAHAARGLDMHLDCLVVELDSDEHGAHVRLGDGTQLDVDVVLFAAGAVPNTEFAVAAGAEAGRGVLVDVRGETTLPDVYAAGDVASYRTPRGKEARIESINNASSQAKSVVRSLMGEEPLTPGAPTFWTEQVGVRIQQAGWIPPDVSTHDIVMQDEKGWVVERYLAGSLVGIESMNRPVEYLKAVRTLTDLRFRM